MPTLFQGICDHCGHKTAVMTAGFGAVFVDRPVAGPQGQVAGAALFSEGDAEIATVDDPRFVVLRHPVEDHDLERAGYRWNDVHWQGRYVEVTNVVCRECGTVFPRRRLAAPTMVGCVTGLATGVVAGLAVGIWRRSFVAAFLSSYVATVAVMYLTGSLAPLYLRLRFRARGASLAAERACPVCHADNARHLERATSLPCPACRQKSLRFVVVGMS